MRKRPGGRFAVSASAIACDHRDLLMLRKPGRRRRLFAVRQKCHRPASLKIADDGPVRVVAPPRPIVNADHVQMVRRQAAAPTNDAQQGVVADRNHQPPRKACRGSASQRQSEMVDNEIESGRPSRGRRQHGVAETLGKNSPTAEHCESGAPQRSDGHVARTAGDRRRGDNNGYGPVGTLGRKTGKSRPCFDVGS